jgi:transcriptional regulator of arginine metabolism
VIVEERPERLRIIRKILRTQLIRSQRTLLTQLKQEGITTTQATLSRDLKLLKAAKQPDGEGGYVYIDPNVFQTSEEPELSLDRSLVFSGNLGLIKTFPGYANSVAYVLDNLAIEEILGTIAGDDTILIVPRDGVTRESLVKALTTRFPVIKEKLF